MNLDQTRQIPSVKDENKNPREIITDVFNALIEKGYNPVSQFIGYIMSGDPTYITSHKNARVLISSLERDEILEELLKSYLNIE